MHISKSSEQTLLNLLFSGNIFQKALENIMSVPANIFVQVITYFFLTASLLSLVTGLLSLVNLHKAFQFIMHNKYTWIGLSFILWFLNNSYRPHNKQFHNPQLVEQIVKSNDGIWSNIALRFSICYLAIYFCRCMFTIRTKIPYLKSRRVRQPIIVVLGIVLFMLYVTTYYLQKIMLRKQSKLEQVPDMPNIVVKDSNEPAIILVQIISVIIIGVLSKKKLIIPLFTLVGSLSCIVVKLLLYKYINQHVKDNNQMSSGSKVITLLIVHLLQGFYFIFYCLNGLKTTYVSLFQQCLFDASMYFYVFMLLAGVMCSPEHYIFIIAIYMIIFHKQ